MPEYVLSCLRLVEARAWGAPSAPPSFQDAISRTASLLRYIAPVGMPIAAIPGERRRMPFSGRIEPGARLA